MSLGTGEPRPTILRPARTDTQTNIPRGLLTPLPLPWLRSSGAGSGRRRRRLWSRSQTPSCPGHSWPRCCARRACAAATITHHPSLYLCLPPKTHEPKPMPVTRSLSKTLVSSEVPPRAHASAISCCVSAGALAAARGGGLWPLQQTTHTACGVSRIHAHTAHAIIDIRTGQPAFRRPPAA